MGGQQPIHRRSEDEIDCDLPVDLGLQLSACHAAVPYPAANLAPSLHEVSAQLGTAGSDCASPISWANMGPLGLR